MKHRRVRWYGSFGEMMLGIEAKSVRDVETGCLYWGGSKDKAGYGKRKAKSGETGLVHRWVKERELGRELGRWELVCHADVCGGRTDCIEPSHLRVDSAKGNSADMVRLGRCVNVSREVAVYGDGGLRADAFARYSRGETQEEVALAHGVHKVDVSNLLSGRTWGSETVVLRAGLEASGCGRLGVNKSVYREDAGKLHDLFVSVGNVESKASIARRHGVHVNTVYAVVRGERLADRTVEYRGLLGMRGC